MCDCCGDFHYSELRCSVNDLEKVITKLRDDALKEADKLMSQEKKVDTLHAVDTGFQSGRVSALDEVLELLDRL